MPYGTPSTPALDYYNISVGGSSNEATILTGSMNIVLEDPGAEVDADAMVQSIVDALSGIPDFEVQARKRFTSLAVITPTETP